MPAYLQSALGSGIGITDYRSHCQIHSQMVQDIKAANERELRYKLMEDPVQANTMRLKYVTPTPYFETDKCWSTTNPPVQFPHYNGM